MLKENDTNTGNDTKSKGGLLARLRPKKKNKVEENEEVVMYTLLDVARHPKLRLYAIIMCLLW